MAEKRALDGPLGPDGEATDGTQQTFRFGDGGVPWLLLLGYLSFLVFFAWYTLDFQLPAFVEEGPLTSQEAVATE